MGKIVVNGREVPIEGQPRTLLEAVSAATKEHNDRGWIVVEVCINGLSIESFTDSEGGLLPYDPEQEVKVQARSPDEILDSSLEGFESYLERLIPGLRKVSELYREDKLDHANKLYREAADGLKVMFDMLRDARVSPRVSTTDLTEDNKSLEQMADDLNTTLQDLVAAQASTRYHQMARIIESQLCPQLESWSQALPVLRHRIAQHR